MAAIDTVYHYYLSTYANSTVSRYDSHKKSELRDIYNRMVKTLSLIHIPSPRDQRGSRMPSSA